MTQNTIEIPKWQLFTSLQIRRSYLFYHIMNKKKKLLNKFCDYGPIASFRSLGFQVYAPKKTSRQNFVANQFIEKSGNIFSKYFEQKHLKLVATS